jgi:hypothetical protein
MVDGDSLTRVEGVTTERVGSILDDARASRSAGSDLLLGKEACCTFWTVLNATALGIQGVPSGGANGVASFLAHSGWY